MPARAVPKKKSHGDTIFATPCAPSLSAMAYSEEVAGYSRRLMHIYGGRATLKRAHAGAWRRRSWCLRCVQTGSLHSIFVPTGLRVWRRLAPPARHRARQRVNTLLDSRASVCHAWLVSRLSPPASLCGRGMLHHNRAFAGFLRFNDTGRIDIEISFDTICKRKRQREDVGF